MAFRALWQTANRANVRLKTTLGGFRGPLTFCIESQSFFHNSFNLYPLGEKIDLADSEKRTPEAKFRPFFSMFQKIVFLKNPHCMAWRAGEFGFVYCREREPRKRAAESHQDFCSQRAGVMRGMMATRLGWGITATSRTSITPS